MTLQPYEHYAQLGDTAAYTRWNARMKYFIIGFALIGAAAGAGTDRGAEAIVVGVFAGALAGYIGFRGVVYFSASSTADQLYRNDWCAARGMTYIGDDVLPPDSPLANKGDERESKDAYEGTWNGLSTLIYNFTYTDVRHDSDGRHETNYDFKIMRLSGRELPVKLLSFSRRGALDFKWVDNLEGMFGPERPVSLESVQFNERFDLTIADDADEIWIRRTFDPQTIQQLVEGRIAIPDLRYYFGAWWFIEREHFRTRELDHWVAKQQVAAAAVELLSRVRTL